MRDAASGSSGTSSSRRSRGVALALAALLLLLSATMSFVPRVPPGAEVQAAETSGAPAQFVLKVSQSPARSDATSLRDRYILSGETYLFLEPPADFNRSIRSVRFFLNPSQEELESHFTLGQPDAIDTTAPYDLTTVPNARGSKARGVPFDTSTLANGTHLVGVAVELRDHSFVTLTERFEVRNGAPSLTARSDALRGSSNNLTVTLQGQSQATIDLDVLPTDGAQAPYAATIDVPWATLTGVSEGAMAPDAIQLVFDSTGLANGVHRGTLTLSADGYDSVAITIALKVDGAQSAASPESDARALAAVAASTSTCTPLPCNQWKVAAPYELEFDVDHGKILDKDGIGTGFTYLQPATFGPGYVPAALDMTTGSPGTLAITTSSGIATRTSNAQENALGVGFDGPGQVTVLRTTLTPPTLGINRYEQGGLWFGTDEANFIKLALTSWGDGSIRIQHLLEVGDTHTLSETTPALNVTSSTALELILRADPTDRTVAASYRLNGGPEVQLGMFTVPGEFFSFDAAGIDPTIGTRSFGGVYVSHRFGSTPRPWTFDRFAMLGEPLPPVETSDLEFSRVSFPVPMPTSVAWGPDGRLYVSEVMGKIHAITLDANKNVVSDQIVHDLGGRLTLGITVDPASTASNVILWVGHSSGSFSNGQLNSGVITRLSGPNFATRQDVITGIPRATANHGTNSIHFGPDGRLYIAQGGNTGAGGANGNPDNEFGTMAEQPLSAAILVADVNAPGFQGQCASPVGSFTIPSTCGVSVYASGMRNAYDFVWHTNGSMYSPDNGLGVTGVFPPSPTAPCTGFGSETPWYLGGHNPGEQPDVLLKVQQGGYYGHPDPYRNECVFKDGSYQSAAPLANYIPPMYTIGMNRSANGTIEYRSNAFNGALQGEILIVNFSIGDDIYRYRLTADGNAVSKAKQLIGGFSDPLALVEGPDGTLYVAEFAANRVTALIPQESATPEDTLTLSPASMSFTLAQDSAAASQALQVSTRDGAAPAVTFSTSAAWLSVSPSAVTAPATTAVQADPTGLAPGVYSASVSASAPGYASVGMQVTLTVNAAQTGIALPGVIEAEDYNPGGEGVGYHDTTAGNAGGMYRQDDVDIERCTDPLSGSTCYNVSSIAGGEWLAYDVQVAQAGTYDISVRVAANKGGRKFQLFLDGASLTPVTNVPNTGGLQRWTSVVIRSVQLPAGAHRLRFETSTGGFNLNRFDISAVATTTPTPTATTTASPTPTSTPTSTPTPTMTPTATPTPIPTVTTTPTATPTSVTLPGTIELENYREGGEGVGYHDLTAGNTGGAYRQDDVDIQTCNDPTSTPPCYAIGWIDAGEWLTYDVNVPTAGQYTFTIRASTPSNDRRIQFSLDGVNISGTITLSNTGGWSTWTDVTAGPFELPQGQHVLRITALNGGFNLNHVVVTAASSAGWSTMAPMPVAILDAGSAAIGSRLYSVAGKTSTSHVRSLYIYDATTNQWTTGPSLPTAFPAVENPAVTTFNGMLYVFGGSTGPFTGAVGSAAVYDPATNAWTMLASMPEPRGGAAAQALDGKIYVAGGMDNSGTSLASVSVYDPETNTWTTGTPMTTRRDNPGAAVVNGTLYVFGGRTRNGDGTPGVNELATVEAYDPATNTWTARASMPTGRRTMAVGVVNGIVYVLGGERTSSGGTFAQNEAYDPATNTWTTSTPMPTPRHGAAFGVIDGTIYIAGGGPTGGGSYSNITEAFTP